MRRGAVGVFVLLVFISLYVHGAFGARASTFVSPDSSLEGFSAFIDSVDTSLHLSIYEIDSPFVYEQILRLLMDGKKVTIIVDDSPAGGISTDELGILSVLQSHGAHVYAAGDQYRFYHGKYGVSDNDTLFLTTENLGRNGFPMRGTNGNRGWGVVVEDPDLSKYFLDVFYNDVNHSSPYKTSVFEINFTTETREYKPLFAFTRHDADISVTPILAPENAESSIIELLDSANKSLYIEQFYIYKYWGARKTGSVEKTPNLFLEHAIDAARRGVKVRLLLDSTWYNVERDDPVSNYHTSVYVNEIARKEGLDLEARLVDLDRLGFEKLHTKGVVVDDKIALISSVNWNENSPKNNREVGVIIDGPPAAYFSDVFNYDWSREEKRDSNWLIAVLLFLIMFSIILYYWKKRNGRADHS